jgi:glycosyltransferase involved in cell wall biosynthesis
MHRQPMKSLSIITPTLNCAATFEATLRAIAPLIEKGAEHIVVDSGSTDGTVQMAEASGAKVLTWPKGNMYAAINEGMREAKGEWLTYINGDDLLYADTVIECLDGAEDGTDLIYGNIDFIDEVGRFLFPLRSPSEKWIVSFVRAYSPVPQQGTLFRRHVFEQLDGFDTQYRFAADFNFWVCALDAGFVFQKYTDRSVAGFRLMATQLSQSRKSEMAPEGRRIRAALREKKSFAVNLTTKAWAFLYRNAFNLDSRMIKIMRGRNLDNR